MATAQDILDRIKSEEVEWVDLRFTDPKGKWQHLTMVASILGEDELTDVGSLTLVDGETGREVRVETSSRTLRDKFAKAAAEERADLARELRRLGASHVVLSTSGSWLRSLAGQLRTIRRAS